MTSWKRLLAQGISRLIVFFIMCIGIPSFLTKLFIDFLVSMDTNIYIICFDAGAFFFLMFLVFAAVLGLAVED